MQSTGEKVEARTSKPHILEVLMLAALVVAFATSSLEWAKHLLNVDPVTVSHRLVTASDVVQVVRVVSVVFEYNQSALVRLVVGRLLQGFL